MKMLQQSWNQTSTKSKIILGILLAAVLVFAVLSWNGTFDPFGVDTGLVIPAEDPGAAEDLTGLE